MLTVVLSEGTHKLKLLPSSEVHRIKIHHDVGSDVVLDMPCLSSVSVAMQHCPYCASGNPASTQYTLNALLLKEGEYVERSIIMSRAFLNNLLSNNIITKHMKATALGLEGFQVKIAKEERHTNYTIKPTRSFFQAALSLLK